jgi:hypothetical protein
VMAARGRAVLVRVDYSQYHVAAGSDMAAGDDSVPGLLQDMGPQAVAVITGRQYGTITVTARAVTAPPTQVDPGWDVVAETDLDCPEGSISVLDWGGPDHPELGELAVAGPGRYRLRVHARNREQADGEKTAEQHYLLLWPTAGPAPPRLLTPMDARGKLLTGEEQPEAPPLDAVELAAVAAVRRLAELVTQPDPPALSGELTTIRSEATVPGAPRKVWNLAAMPRVWLGNSGGGDPAHFSFGLHDEPRLEIRGDLIIEEPSDRLAFTWSWTTTRWVEVERPMPTGVMSRDLLTGQLTSVTRMERGLEIVDSWMLPSEPTTVHISLRRAGKGRTAVELEHRELPVELAEAVQPFWDWALQRELRDQLARTPFYGYPWER